ncbi:MAG TPA: helix-turn-helix transcriptional regulator [Candidatus Dormibacteraeota bacterium]|nr:helix-turn-helix transcriptional regulator [Candidatus Dormibacteraeota bacterium]
MNATEFGVLLAGARTRARLTQVELAGRMGTRQSVIARAEAGGRLPTLEFIDRWARATGVPITMTLGQDAEPISASEKRALIDAVLGPGRFDPWQRNPSEVEAKLLRQAGHGPAYFQRLRGPRGRPPAARKR